MRAFVIWIWAAPSPSEVTIGVLPAPGTVPLASTLKSTFNAPLVDWRVERSSIAMPVAESTRSEAVPPSLLTTSAAVSNSTPKRSCPPSALAALLASVTSVPWPSARPSACELIGLEAMPPALGKLPGS